MADIRAGQRLTAQALREIFGNVAGIRVGVVTITPVANTVTSETISGLDTPGTLHAAFVTANTTSPAVEEVSASGVSATGLTVNLLRTNTTNTVVWWMHVGYDS